MLPLLSSLRRSTRRRFGTLPRRPRRERGGPSTGEQGAEVPGRGCSGPRRSRPFSGPSTPVRRQGSGTGRLSPSCTGVGSAWRRRSPSCPRMWTSTVAPCGSSTAKATRPALSLSRPRGPLALVERWLTERKTLGITSRPRRFCTLQRARRSTRPYVRQLLPRLAGKGWGREAGARPRVPPHPRGRTRPRRPADQPDPGPARAPQLGHRYLRDIAPKERLNALRGRQWDP